MKTWKIAGINFDHMHMGDLLRQAREYPKAEIVGICDEDLSRMQGTAQTLSIPSEQHFTDYWECIEKTKPDIVILCPATGRHGEYVEKVAPFGVNVLVEKPMASSLADADAMIAAMAKSGKQMIINWPLAWYPPHVTTHRLIMEDMIGDVVEVHYYDGNRGPMRHIADKVEISEEEAARKKGEAWWYQKDKGGGSLMDYLGYGVTLGTWFHGGRAPIEVTTVTGGAPGLEVDEHSITIARYKAGISKYETRWGTFTDPWVNQPQPKCGFVVMGTKGTIASYDYEQSIRLQTREHPEGEVIPVDKLETPRSAPIEYFIHCLETGEPVTGPLDPKLCRIGQQIVDSAVLSAQERRTVALLP